MNAMQVILNAREKEALKSQVESARGNGFDFGYSDEICFGRFTKHEYAGYTAQLVQKKLITIDGEYGQTAPYSSNFGDGKYEAWKVLEDLANS